MLPLQAGALLGPMTGTGVVTLGPVLSDLYWLAAFANAAGAGFLILFRGEREAAGDEGGVLQLTLTVLSASSATRWRRRRSGSSTGRAMWRACSRSARA